MNLEALRFSMKILICDDDPTTLRFLTEIITKMGFEAVTCVDGEKALEILSGENPPRMAILDWMVPLMSGIDVVKKVRENSTLISSHLILLTSKDCPDEIAAGLEAGASDYITKPFNVIELRARLNLGIKLLNLQKELRTLTGFLSICSWCKKIYSEENKWVRMEEYIQENTYAKFSHGGCPQCLAKVKK